MVNHQIHAAFIPFLAALHLFISLLRFNLFPPLVISCHPHTFNMHTLSAITTDEDSSELLETSAISKNF